MNRYDYPDPGLDAAYCDGLAPEYDGPTCIYCGEPLYEAEDSLYCPWASCAVLAELDSMEDAS